MKSKKNYWQLEVNTPSHIDLELEAKYKVRRIHKLQQQKRRERRRIYEEKFGDLPGVGWHFLTKKGSIHLRPEEVRRNMRKNS
ncbi:MAG: hypothetical protein JEZ03_17190 [Bacteroidales bacterium]|nr:hypothetical protein [Bacteroidales bacterium]